MCNPNLPLKSSRVRIVRVMSKRGKRDPSFHYLAVSVTQNMTRLHNSMNWAVIPVSDRYDDATVHTVYKFIADGLNAMGTETYEIVTVVSVNRPSKSKAFLKLLSIIPDAEQPPETLQSELETIFNNNTVMLA